MTNSAIHNSPRFYARLAGVLYLLNIACGIWGELVVRARLIVHADPAATAHHILASELLFRSGIAVDLVMHLTDIPLILIFYILLRPINRDLALLTALFNIIQTAVLVANKLNLIAVLSFLKAEDGLSSLAPQQLQALAALALDLHESGFAIGLIFFGVTCLLTGYLIYKSGYFPKIFGVLQLLAGVSYLVNSFALILSPPFVAKLVPAILLPAFVGELAFALYLTIRGINLPAWTSRALHSKSDGT